MEGVRTMAGLVGEATESSSKERGSGVPRPLPPEPPCLPHLCVEAPRGLAGLKSGPRSSVSQTAAPDPCGQVWVLARRAVSWCTDAPGVCFLGRPPQSATHYVANTEICSPTAWRPEVQNQGVGRAVLP